MGDWKRIVAAGALVLVALAPIVNAAALYRTDVIVPFGNAIVQYAWNSADGAFEGVGGSLCEVTTVHGDLNGAYHCVYRRLTPITSQPNPDGSTTHEFEIFGVYGSPYAFEVFSPYATAAVGQRAAYDFLLRIVWTHTPDGAIERAVVQPTSHVGTLHARGEIPAAVLVRGPTAIDAPVEIADDIVECIETKC